MDRIPNHHEQPPVSHDASTLAEFAQFQKESYQARQEKRPSPFNQKETTKWEHIQEYLITFQEKFPGLTTFADIEAKMQEYIKATEAVYQQTLDNKDEIVKQNEITSQEFDDRLTLYYQKNVDGGYAALELFQQNAQKTSLGRPFEDWRQAQESNTMEDTEESVEQWKELIEDVSAVAIPSIHTSFPSDFRFRNRNEHNIQLPYRDGFQYLQGRHIVESQNMHFHQEEDMRRQDQAFRNQWTRVLESEGREGQEFYQVITFEDLGTPFLQQNPLSNQTELQTKYQNENAVAFQYLFQFPTNSRVQWVGDYDAENLTKINGRNGNLFSLELVIPESLAEQLSQELSQNDNPQSVIDELLHTEVYNGFHLDDIETSDGDLWLGHVELYDENGTTLGENGTYGEADKIRYQGFAPPTFLVGQVEKDGKIPSVIVPFKSAGDPTTNLDQYRKRL